MRLVLDCRRYDTPAVASQVRYELLLVQLMDWITGRVPVQQVYPSLMEMVSTYQPFAPLLLSLPKRQRNRTGWPAAAAGRFTVVVMNPLELPLQACRPASGLPK